MDFLKKYRHCFTGSSVFLAFICLFICFGAGVSGVSTTVADVSLYTLAFDFVRMQIEPGILIAWILMVLGILVGGGATALLCLKKNTRTAGYLSTAAAILFLISSVLYFSVLGFTGTTSYEIGAGAVWNGVLLILAFIVMLIGSVGAIFDNNK